jgi:hypothetical protein
MFWQSRWHLDSLRGTLLRDMSGTLWLGGSVGLARGKPGSFETFVAPALNGLEQLSGVTALANGPNGSMLIGIGAVEFICEGRWARN